MIARKARQVAPLQPGSWRVPPPSWRGHRIGMRRPVRFLAVLRSFPSDEDFHAPPLPPRRERERVSAFRVDRLTSHRPPARAAHPRAILTTTAACQRRWDRPDATPCRRRARPPPLLSAAAPALSPPPKFLRNPPRIALSCRPKSGSVSTRVNPQESSNKEHPVELNLTHELAALRRLTPRELWRTLRRGLRRAAQHQEQGLAAQAPRLAPAESRRGRPLPTRPPTRRRTGQRRRPAHHLAPDPHAPTRRRPSPPRRRRAAAAPARGQPPARTRHRPDAEVQGRPAAGARAPGRLRVRRPRLPLAQRRRPRHHRRHCNGFLFFHDALTHTGDSR